MHVVEGNTATEEWNIPPDIIEVFNVFTSHARDHTPDHIEQAAAFRRVLLSMPLAPARKHKVRIATYALEMQATDGAGKMHVH